MRGKRFMPFWEILVDSRAVGFILIAGTIFFLTPSILPAPQPVHHSLLQPALVIIGVIAGMLAVRKYSCTLQAARCKQIQGKAEG